MQARFTWNLVRRDRKPVSRAGRIARAAFRVGRNIAAVLGLLFAYLLVLGYFQYMDQATQNDIVCAVGRCL